LSNVMCGHVVMIHDELDWFCHSTFAPEISAIVWLHARSCVTTLCCTLAYGLYGRTSDTSTPCIWHLYSCSSFIRSACRVLIFLCIRLMLPSSKRFCFYNCLFSLTTNVLSCETVLSLEATFVCANNLLTWRGRTLGAHNVASDNS
jgi:hypothetical protein